jgi:catechol 2,3-dioxygenase-like lactoylglutathione lyase family enzyme
MRPPRGGAGSATASPSGPGAPFGYRQRRRVAFSSSPSSTAAARCRRRASWRRRGSAVDGLDHVVVTTARADESRRVYEDVLGLRLALDRTFEERGLRLLFFRVGGVTVEVAGSLAGGDADSGVDDLWGLAYKVADVDAARRRLAAGGFDVTEARRGHKQGTRVFTVRSGTNGVATLVIGPEREDG